MRGIQKALTATVAVGVAATMVACSSDASSPKPVGQFTTLTGNTTTVVLNPDFLAGLKSLGVTPGTFGTGKITTVGSDTDAVFPITGGNATIYNKADVTPYVQGEIDHQGSGLTLSAGGTTVTIKNFVVHPGSGSNLTGEVDVTTGGKTSVFAKSAKLFDLDGGTLKTPSIDKSTGIATLQGTTVYLSETAAGALNKVYKLTGSKALKGGVGTGLKIGTAVIKATGK